MPINPTAPPSAALPPAAPSDALSRALAIAPPAAPGPSPYEALQDQFGGPLSMLGAGTEGALDALTFGLSTGVETKLIGISPQDIIGRAQANPLSHGLGTALGVLAPLAVTGGGAAPAEGASALSTAARLGTAPGLISSLGTATTKAAAAAIAKEGAEKYLGTRLVAGSLGGAMEGLAYGAGQTVHESFLGDPQHIGETLAMSGLFGGVIGGSVGAAGWARALAGEKLAPWLTKLQESGIAKQMGIQLPAPGILRDLDDRGTLTPFTSLDQLNKNAAQLKQEASLLRDQIMAAGGGGSDSVTLGRVYEALTDHIASVKDPAVAATMKADLDAWADRIAPAPVPPPTAGPIPDFSLPGVMPDAPSVLRTRPAVTPSQVAPAQELADAVKRTAKAADEAQAAYKTAKIAHDEAAARGTPPLSLIEAYTQAGDAAAVADQAHQNALVQAADFYGSRAHLPQAPIAGAPKPETAASAAETRIAPSGVDKRLLHDAEDAIHNADALQEAAQRRDQLAAAAHDAAPTVQTALARQRAADALSDANRAFHAALAKWLPLNAADEAATAAMMADAGTGEAEAAPVAAETLHALPTTPPASGESLADIMRAAPNPIGTPDLKALYDTSIGGNAAARRVLDDVTTETLPAHSRSLWREALKQDRLADTAADLAKAGQTAKTAHEGPITAWELLGYIEHGLRGGLTAAVLRQAGKAYGPGLGAMAAGGFRDFLQDYPASALTRAFGDMKASMQEAAATAKAREAAEALVPLRSVDDTILDDAFINEPEEERPTAAQLKHWQTFFDQMQKEAAARQQATAQLIAKGDLSRTAVRSVAEEAYKAAARTPENDKAAPVAQAAQEQHLGFAPGWDQIGSIEPSPERPGSIGAYLMEEAKKAAAIAEPMTGANQTNRGYGRERDAYLQLQWDRAEARAAMLRDHPAYTIEWTMPGKPPIDLKTADPAEALRLLESRGSPHGEASKVTDAKDRQLDAEALRSRAGVPSPQEKVSALSAIGAAVDDTTAKAQTEVKAYLGGEAPARTPLPKSEDILSALATITKLAANQQGTTSLLAQAISPISEHAPMIATASAAAAARVIQTLAQVAPQETQAGPLSAPQQPTRDALLDWHRWYEAARDPVANVITQPERVAALYPTAMDQTFRPAVMEGIMGAQTPLTYAQKVQLSPVVGQDLTGDVTLSQQMLAQQQQALSASASPPAPQGKGPGVAGGKLGTKRLGALKIASRQRTPLQAANELQGEG